MSMSKNVWGTNITDADILKVLNIYMGLYPVVTSQYIAIALYQISYR
jgi:hypothetical protein